MKTNGKNHKVNILNHLKKYGSITPVISLNGYYLGGWRLASYINRLRNDGHNIVTVPYIPEGKKGEMAMYIYDPTNRIK